MCQGHDSAVYFILLCSDLGQHNAVYVEDVIAQCNLLRTDLGQDNAVCAKETIVQCILFLLCSDLGQHNAVYVEA